MLAKAYLAAWLLCLALPAGALPLVMAADLAGWSAGIVPPLRRLLVVMPPAAVAVLPILLMLPALYPSAHGTWFTMRVVAALCLWTALALKFRRRSGPAAAIAGLILHAIIATLIGTDLVLSLGKTVNSSGFGLLLIAAQSGAALAAAMLLAPANTAGTLLLALLAAWGFMHFTQFLIIWSANQPGDIGFYLDRQAPLAEALACIGAAALFAASLLAWQRRPPAWLPLTAAGLVLLTHAADMLWLAS